MFNKRLHHTLTTLLLRYTMLWNKYFITIQWLICKILNGGTASFTFFIPSSPSTFPLCCALSFISLPLFPFLRFPIFHSSFLPSVLLPKSSQMISGSTVSSPSKIWGRAPVTKTYCCILGAIIVTGGNNFGYLFSCSNQNPPVTSPIIWGNGVPPLKK